MTIESTKRHNLVSSVPKYDTGWVANSDWTDAEFTATHNLGLALDKLDIEFLISTDGTDANSFKIQNTNYDPNSPSTTWGSAVFYVSNNEIKINTGITGLLYINDSGVATSITTESWYYKIIVRAKDQFITQRPKFLENSDIGTAPFYGCRAWVNFNGTGTVAIRESGNVSSITDNGTGNYTVNFTTNMADANYTCVVMSAQIGGANPTMIGFNNDTQPHTVSQYGIYCVLINSPVTTADAEYIELAFLR